MGEMRLLEGLRRAAWAWQAGRALAYARRQGTPGVLFGDYGRRAGWRLLASGAPWGLNWLVNPVSVVRYFEFDFAWRHLRTVVGQAADISSPRLFSFYRAAQGLGRVDMFNPDGSDLARSQDAASRLGLSGMEFVAAGAEALAQRVGQYSALWSISVLEHIDGPYDERQALRWAWAALRPGGRLVVTVPAARQFRIESKMCDPYSTQPRRDDGSYFFQRVYDRQAVMERLVGSVGKEPEHVALFGEKRDGELAAYGERWARLGIRETVQDPRFIADRFQSYADWSELPGLGVVGLSFTKS